MRQPWVHGRARRDGLVHIGTAEAGTLCGRRLRFTEPDIPLPTCHPCLRTAQSRGGVVYLLHFDQPFGHARHYMGWSGNLRYRLACHQAGTGANLLRHVAEAGIAWRLAGLWYGDRHLERAMKNHGHARRCPECRAWRKLTDALTIPDNGQVSRPPTASEGEILL